MASSVFADSPVSSNESRMAGELQSDLVVVYGKKGVNVDSAALDNLLENRNISSVSVVRLTSPTPSMEEEEAQHEDEGIGGDDSDLLSTLESKDSNDKPEIVGLTVEEFYPEDEAKQLAKEILNYAGVANPLQIKIDYEFQRFVIQNDHCYTPLTSPSQSKPQSLVNSSSSAENKPTAVRQYTGANRSRKTGDGSAELESNKNESEDEDDDEYSDYSDSSLSDSDNDRDSDLDFSVNARGRRRKASTKKTRKSLAKTPRKQRQSITEKDSQAEDEQKKTVTVRSVVRQSLATQTIKAGQKAVVAVKTITRPVQRLSSIDTDKVQLPDQKSRVVQTNTMQKALQQQQHIQQRQLQQQQIQMQIQQQQHLIQQQIQQQQKQQQQQQKQQHVQLQNEAPKPQVQKVYLFKKEVVPAARVLENSLSQPEAVLSAKQVILVESQPETRSQTILASAAQHTPPIATTQFVNQISTKGFMPLGVDTAAKNQLPAQISIQTHTSSTELAIENDKQLDLIDSIVKDEMQKPNVVIKHSQETNKDIPQIVKMLESTESAILNKKPIEVSGIASTSATFTNPVEHFDIANADLLDNPDDDLYKDLLQHVAELRNDKQLQEVIEKQGYGVGTSSPLTISDANNLIGLAQSIQHQGSVSISVEAQQALERKESIKIVRGDGRVITLPPIEAPTTRAKRRAQSQYVGASLSNANRSGVAVVKEEPMQRRESAENRGAVAAKKRSSVSSSQGTHKDEGGETEESQEEEDSEDDPNKLWCICRQPHNNRFMICCDKCEDWFHGTCVNITKAMGREMENSGKEWTCPNCIKDKKKPIQKKITEIFDKKPVNQISTPKSKPDVRKPAPITVRKSSTKKTSIEAPGKCSVELIQRKISEAIKTNKVTSGPPPLVKSVEVIVTNLKVNEGVAVHERQQTSKQDISKINEPAFDCIVCQKRCRPNSIYCSDDCIRRHAQNALITVNKAAKAAAAAAATSTTAPSTPDEKKKKTPSSFEEALARAADPTVQIKNKVERVYVFERKTGRILTGTNAPTTANLKKWLQENPTFEVVQPGSPEAMAIERSKQKHIKIGPLNISAASVQVSPSAPSSAATPPPLKKITEPKLELKQEMSLKLHKAQIVDVGKGPRANLVQNAFRSLPQFTSDGLNKPLKTTNSEVNPRQAVVITQTLKKYPQQVSIKPVNSQPPSEAKTLAKTPRKLPTQPVEQKPTAPPETLPKPDNEPIRLNVRKTLKEHLINRMNEVKFPGMNRLSTAAIEHFATEVESEMFSLFNKDTGTKYKAKYRSLTFNIKDKKNDTLMQKILERKIEPRQLVRMSAEEMASQELTQWRQNENKHQLEMIKKSELDLLSCAKNYVLKTHKGEEVIESKSIDRVSLDITIPVEDVVTVLNNSTVSSTSEVDLLSPGKDSNRTQSMSDVSQDADSSYNTAAESTKASNLNISKEKKQSKHEKERDRHNRTKEKHKANRKRSRSRSRDRRHRSPHRDEKHKSPNRDDGYRSPTQEDKRKSPLREDRHKSPRRDEKHKSPHYEDRHKSPLREERNKSPNRDGGHKSPHRDERRRSPHHEERHRSPHRTEKHKSPNRDQIGNEKNEGAVKLFLHRKDDKKDEQHREKAAEKSVDLKAKGIPKHVAKPKNKERKTDEVKSKTGEGIQNFSLVDKIIESSKTVEEAANISSEKDKTECKSQASSSAVSTTTIPSIDSTSSTKEVKKEKENSGGDSDQEPSSTVNIPSRPEDQYRKYVGDLSSIIWSGSINMIDVATFQIVIQPVVGVTSEIEKQLAGELDVVGRISPETVWDYISKIKKSPNKEIVIVRLVPSCETENTAYFALYKYLNSRRRLGVVKTVSPNMKDFYILPFSAGKALPTILRPQDTVDFFDDDARPDLLLGIIIRIMSKRSSMASGHHSQSKVARKPEHESVISNQSAAEENRYTPPSKKSEKSIISATRLPPKSDDSMNINTMMNPTGKMSKAAYTADDADEPYSPGGSTDDDTPGLSNVGATNANTATESLTDEDLKRKMDEINRQIEARKMEIAGMLGIDQSSSSFNSGSAAECKPALASISIPSNLQQILASIKPPQDKKHVVPPPPSIGPLLNIEKDEEYVPEATPVNSFKPLPPPPVPPTELLSKVFAPTSSNSSRLAQLSEAELLSMVPDGVDLGIEKKAAQNSNKNDASSTAEPPAKRGRWIKEPPPPGLEEEFI